MDKGRLKILLVDDSEIVLRHVAVLLEKEGWMVVQAKNLAQALDAFMRHKPKVILADFIMESGQTGLGLLSTLIDASKQAGGKMPPAAILTHGALTEIDQKRADQLGIPVFQKPVRGKEAEFIQNLQFWLKDLKLIG